MVKSKVKILQILWPSQNIWTLTLTVYFPLKYWFYLLSAIGWEADTHFASQIILLLGTLYFKVAWYTLLPNLLCSSTHSTPWHILLLSTLIFLEQFAAWNSLLPGTLKNCIKFWSKVFQAENCYRKQSVTRSKVFVSQWNADLNCPAEYESGRVVLALA